ncbi:hypothetical protein [Meiothermus sp.]|uniref:hypothetical protein n=1 Tax=Meiothermus sp. TaxID=1955249 RepID=UPI0021DDCE3D|nr:hypothetical protein [Meiothermus sp.]GIW24537.1 MAG: hypothetical protein KatS3mg069_0804 [Meiothermus sp.]
MVKDRNPTPTHTLQPDWLTLEQGRRLVEEGIFKKDERLEMDDQGERVWGYREPKDGTYSHIQALEVGAILTPDTLLDAMALDPIDPILGQSSP